MNIPSNISYQYQYTINIHLKIKITLTSLVSHKKIQVIAHLVLRSSGPPALSMPKAKAAAVGSLMIRATSRPEIFPASWPRAGWPEWWGRVVIAKPQQGNHRKMAIKTLFYQEKWGNMRISYEFPYSHCGLWTNITIHNWGGHLVPKCRNRNGAPENGGHLEGTLFKFKTEPTRYEKHLWSGYVCIIFRMIWPILGSSF